MMFSIISSTRTYQVHVEKNEIFPIVYLSIEIITQRNSAYKKFKS